MTALLRECLAAARSSVVPSALVALVVAAMCFAAISTVGRQAAVEASVAQSLSGPAARTLSVTDTSGNAGITGPVLTSLAGLSGTQAVIGRESPVDAVNGHLGPGAQRVAVIAVHGTLDQAITITQGRAPGPGEAIVSAPMLETLRMAHPSGFLQAPGGAQWAIVGQFEPNEPFEDLAGFAVTRPETTATTVIQQVRVVAATPQSAALVRDAALAVLAVDSTQVQVATPTVLSSTNRDVTGQLAGLGRSMLLLILAVGAFFVAVVVLADVLIRRRDLGRRRTLGITRTDLVLLVAGRTSTPALIGALTGSTAAYLLLTHQAQSIPVSFVLGVASLATLTAAAASLPPATYAATRDPVAVMRTP